MPFIYLAHSLSDREFVKTIAERLGNISEEIWIDGVALEDDASLLDSISGIAGEVDVLAVFLSNNSSGAKWLKNDVDFIMKNRMNDRMIKVLPITVNECDIPVSMLDMARIDFSDRRSKAQGIDEKIRKLAEMVLEY